MRYKLFLDDNNKILSFKVDDRISYYEFVQRQRAEGYYQFLINSKLMISIIINILKKTEFDLSAIDLYDTDEILMQDYMKKEFKKLKNKKNDPEKIHRKLNVLDSEFSIDIATVTLMDTEGRVILRSNGTFDTYDKSSKDIILKQIKRSWNNDYEGNN